MWLRLVVQHIRPNSSARLEGLPLTNMSFPREHWIRIRTNNPLERILKEVSRRTWVVGAFPDGQSALMLVAPRLRHIAGTGWGTKAYLNMKRLEEAHTSLAIAG